MKLKKYSIIAAIALTIISGVTTTNVVSAYENTKTVFIDAGHGGNDNGTSHNGYVEDSLNLEIANRVAKKLKQNNINVLFTRQDDTYVSLSKRTQMSNNSDADLFISIHQNASYTNDPNGIETYYMGNNEKLAKTIQQNLIENTYANDRGHRVQNLQVLRDNNLPSVLVECGFISNSNEAHRLSTLDYQEKVANGIVKGILEYLDADNIVESTSTYSSNTKTALNTTNVMSDMDKNSDIIGTLPIGTKIEVLDSRFGWLKVKYNSKIGYVSGVYVK